MAFSLVWEHVNGSHVALQSQGLLALERMQNSGLVLGRSDGSRSFDQLGCRKCLVMSEAISEYKSNIFIVLHFICNIYFDVKLIV